MWDTLRAGPASSSLPVPAPERKRKSAPEGLEPFLAAPQPKRRQSGAEAMIRIQPKPPSNGSPHAFNTPPATQPKKRGRPSKAEIEARNAAAIARGEIIPPPRTPAARKSMGGDASSEAPVRSGGFGEFGGVAAAAPKVAPGPLSESKMSMSFQTGPSDADASDMTSKKKRGRPGSRSSKVGDSSELGEHRADQSLQEPRQGEGSFSSFDASAGQLETPQPPTTNAPASEASKQPAGPPKLEQGGFAAPVYPAIDALLSPEPPRPSLPDALL